MDLRCPNGIKFGELNDGLVEVKCRSSRCGAGAGVLVIHQFDPINGELVATKRYRDIATSNKDRRQGNDSADRAAIRYA